MCVNVFAANLSRMSPGQRDYAALVVILIPASTVAVDRLCIPDTLLISFDKAVKAARRLMGAASWSLVDQLAAPLIALALVPYMLRNMGAEQFGSWVLSMSFLGLMQFVSLGSSVALISEISHRQHSGERASVAGLVRCTVAIVLCGSVVSMFAAWAVVPLLPSRVPGWSVNSLAQQVALTVMVIAVSEIDNVFANSLRGLERFDLAARIELAGRAVWALAVVIVAATAGSAVAVLFVTLGLTLFKAGVKALAVQRLLQPRTPVWWPDFSKSEARTLVSFGGWALVHSLAGLLFFSTDRWLIAAILGATSLATYSICLQFAQIPHTLLSAGLQVIVPFVSRALGAGDVESLLRHGMRGAAWAAAACLVVPAMLAVFAQVILTHWISPAFATQNVDLTLLLLLAFAVLCASIPAHFMLIGLGEIRFVSLLNLLAGCVCAFLLLVLDLTSLQGFAAVRIVFGMLLLTSWWRLHHKLRSLKRSVTGG